MGVQKNVSHDEFPEQGMNFGKRCEVVFNYDLRNILMGTIVRDDREDPYITIIRLNDGRYVMSTECQYSPES